MSAHASPFRLTPQQLCDHNPCWCGVNLRDRHTLGEYDAEKTAAWLAHRRAQRAAREAKP